MISSSRQLVLIFCFSVFITLVLPTYMQAVGMITPVTLSVNVYALMLLFCLVCCIGKYSFYNPIFIYCLLQLTIYSTSWLSSIAVVNFSGDTLMGMGVDDTNSAIAKYFLLSTLWLFVATLTYFYVKRLD